MMVARSAKGFDANFYMSHYSDLSMIKSKRQALRHFVNYGRSDNRFRNLDQYLKSNSMLNHELRSKFDIAAYKFYNKDLLVKFENDEDLFNHFVNHGFAEGRISLFPDDDENVFYEEKDKWKIAFSVSDFVAWCGTYLTVIPKTKEEVIEIFCKVGIDNLWPISFAYRFDIDFFRENAMMPACEGMVDADVYRAWLTEGFPAGIAPNEQILLASYLGGLPFPMNFDWRAFAGLAGLSHLTTRSKALMALFDETPRKIIRHVGLMGQDATCILDCIGRRALNQGDLAKAIAMFRQSPSPTSEILCLLGDAYRQQGAIDDALEAYLASIAMERAPIWSFLRAADIYADRRDFANVFAVLRIAYEFWRQKVEFGRKLQGLLQAYFDHQSARAHAMYREAGAGSSGLVKRAAADALMTDTLDEIQGLLREMDSLPAPVGGDPDGYVAILANDDLRQCTHYRIEQKAFQFEEAQIPVRIFSHSDVQGFMDSLIGARSAIFYRVAAVPHILRAILHANSMDLPTFYEIDDLIFDAKHYPDPYDSFEGQISATEYAGLQFGVPLFRYAMAMCKGSIASTPALAERMKAITATPSGIVIRNGLDERNDPAIVMGANPVRRTDGRVRIFYGSGTKAHNADFNRLLGPALLDLMRRYPHVDLVIAGHLKVMAEIAVMEDRILFYPFTPDIIAYWSILAGCDINLAVLEKGIVADCKSEIKWLEAAILQIPSVVSGTKTYREILNDGEDGFIADTPEQWRAILERLIGNPELRAAVGARARAKALTNYATEVAAQRLTGLFDTVAPVQAVGARKRLKILICNVFYAPQSYGGATRVVEDNVRTFQARFPDLDIAIFCSMDGAVSAGQLSMGTEDGIAVYRLSTPQEVNIDWRPFNDAHAEPFERVLDHFKPDIIHFHCIQRLTATIVEVALRRAIPYVVTLHDAWWISDNQFLVDPDGLLQLPSMDMLGDCQGSPHGSASIARRQRLTSLLQGAKAALSVSAPFADIYAKAGISNLRVVENGTPSLKVVPRTPRSDGRVALGHVGGRSAHKGATLIEATLRRGDYRHLHLTMVDGTFGPGQYMDTIWGTTPVRLTAPFAQTQVAQLYSRLDVLMAPSTWPESFGLVTREALASGLWVVASHLGAIGQDIVEHRNGHLVDVTTTEDLSRIFAEIDANPVLYRSQPLLHQPAVRTMHDQATELHAIYHEFGARSIKATAKIGEEKRLMRKYQRSSKVIK
jgi:glycosyltransferase involved in cell wall biosynthesis